MDDVFDIPVEYGGKQLSFKAELLSYGYSYRIKIDVYGTDILFEPDEERNFRAMIDVNDTHVKSSGISPELIKAITEVIEATVKRLERRHS